MISVMRILKKKLVGGLKKIFFIIFLFIFFISKNSNASRILDYETENFIKTIILEIKKINNITKNINFIIISNEEINAYVNQDNLIHITTGLIENCDDYVALLSVIAHEIGHIDMSHIKQRELSSKKLQNINKLSNLSIIAGSFISTNPDILQGLAVSSAGLADININFSKDQEREADYYSLNTLKKLNIHSNSIINLLNKIETRTIERGITKEKLRLSTHPYFEERIDIVNYLNNSKSFNFNKNKNIKFKFIQAKYLGYSGNKKIIKDLENPFNEYANAIVYAKNGDLKNSLIKLNSLISKYPDNIFLIETKADILYSYGFTDESVEFYNKVLNDLPNNLYSQIRIFENLNFDKFTPIEKQHLFYKNLNLLEKFYNNKNILLKYLNLSLQIENIEWSNFLNFWINKDIYKIDLKSKIVEFRNTDDKDLKKLINIIYKNLV